jgi:transposase
MPIIGVDVSKAKLHCLLLLGPEYEKTRQKAVTNDTEGFEALLAWACRQAGCESHDSHIVMEATGIYHERAALAFYDAGARVSVVNPAHSMDFAKGLAVRSKSDTRDRAVLARYGALLKPAPWEPPPLEVRHLKALLARLEALETDLRRELNRREQAMLTGAPEAVQSSLENSIAFLEEEKRRLEREIDDHIQRHPELQRDKDLLESIPAVGPKTARKLLALTRAGVLSATPPRRPPTSGWSPSSTSPEPASTDDRGSPKPGTPQCGLPSTWRRWSRSNTILTSANSTSAFSSAARPRWPLSGQRCASSYTSPSAS